MEVSSQLQSQTALPSYKEAPTLLEIWLGGPQYWSRRCEEGKYLVHLPGVELQFRRLPGGGIAIPEDYDFIIVADDNKKNYNSHSRHVTWQTSHRLT
jgi:hypothetical protein